MQIPEEYLTYQIIIGNNVLATGRVLDAITIVSAATIILIALTIYLWKGLRDNNRMKYEFITIVAHKFRTPLTYIKWVCDTLITEETDSFKKESIQNITKSNQKLIDLTGTLIEIADSESSGSSTYVYKKIVANDLVKNVVNNLKDTFHEKNIVFGFECNNNKAMVWADQARLEFVITTLLENACVYTPPAKSVNVIVKATLLHINISVEDSGIGISKKDLPNIFTKFFRGKNARHTDTEGFGVGLYLASSITRHLHGKIHAESPGEDLGSKFTITLPRAR